MNVLISNVVVEGFQLLGLLFEQVYPEDDRVLHHSLNRLMLLVHSVTTTANRCFLVNIFTSDNCISCSVVTWNLLLVFCSLRSSQSRIASRLRSSATSCEMHHNKYIVMEYLQMVTLSVLPVNAFHYVGSKNSTF